MFLNRLFVSILFFLALHPFCAAVAQMSGSRGGAEEYGDERPSAKDGLPRLTREVVESFIAVEGAAEVRVKPTKMRVVLAVTSEGKTAQECQAAVKEQIERVRGGWKKLNIGDDQIVEDFIAILPTYAWEIEKKGDRDANVEKQTGFKMQTNLHLSIANDDNADKALGAAFEQGLTDIIAFDYWSPEIDAAKARAREQAIKEAKSKAETLLSVFEKRPGVVNVQEETAVRRPESLYESFNNSVDSQVRVGWSGRDLPTFFAPRPKNTYYRGLQSNRDIQGSALPMQMEISVVSTVRIYYESPAAGRAEKKGKEKE